MVNVWVICTSVSVGVGVGMCTHLECAYVKCVKILGVG